MSLVLNNVSVKLTQRQGVGDRQLIKLTGKVINTHNLSF